MIAPYLRAHSLCKFSFPWEGLPRHPRYVLEARRSVVLRSCASGTANLTWGLAFPLIVLLSEIHAAFPKRRERPSAKSSRTEPAWERPLRSRAVSFASPTRGLPPFCDETRIIGEPRSYRAFSKCCRLVCRAALAFLSPSRSSWARGNPEGLHDSSVAPFRA